MTETEKNERIKAVEKQMAKLKKELEDIRNAETTPEWNLSDWNDALLRKKYEFDIPANLNAVVPFCEKIDMLLKLIKFKFCYDYSYVPNFNDETAKYYIIFSKFTERYDISYIYAAKTPGVVYFSSEEIARKCADWLNEGCPGYLEQE